MTKKKKRTLIRRYLLAAMLCFCTAALAVLSADSIGGRRAFYNSIYVNGNAVVVHNDLQRNCFTEEDFQRENGRMTCLTAPFRTGVDVSSHQGAVDWKAVAGDGITFAMLRCGYRGYVTGDVNPDERFGKNAEEAAAAGLDVGAYFFSQAVSPEEAREEAEFVLNMVKGYDLTLPIVYDWEVISTQSSEEGARTDSLSVEEATASALAFCQTIREAGYEAMVYCNNETGYFSYDIRQIQQAELPVWFAAYHAEYPNYYYQVDWWQYTDQGTVSGIKGDADLNIMLLPAPEEGEE